MKTAREALARLKEGNIRFLEGQTGTQDLIEQVHETAEGSLPFAVVLGCIDSRVPPELVFDQGIGDVFSVRVAGNYASPEVVDCLEFAVNVAGVRLAVILGHTDCMAIKVACDPTPGGSLQRAMEYLTPAVAGVVPSGGPSDATNAAFVRAAAERNVNLTVESVVRQSPSLREAVASKDVQIIGAMHEVATGRVTFLDS